MRALIAEAVNLIVSIVKADNSPGRRIDEVVAVRGFVDCDYQFANVERIDDAVFPRHLAPEPGCPRSAASFLVIVALASGHCTRCDSGGGSLPWDTPLTTLKN